MDFAARTKKAKRGRGYAGFDAVLVLIGLGCLTAIIGAGYLVLRFVSSKQWKTNGSYPVHSPFSRLSVLDVEEGHGMQFTPGDDVTIEWKWFDSKTGETEGEGTLSPVALGSGELIRGVDLGILGYAKHDVPPMRDYGKRIIMIPAGKLVTNSDYNRDATYDMGMGEIQKKDIKGKKDYVFEVTVFTWNAPLNAGGFNDSYQRHSIEPVSDQRAAIQIGPFDPNMRPEDQGGVA